MIDWTTPANHASKRPVWDGADWVMVDMPWHVQIVPILGTLPIVGSLAGVQNSGAYQGGVAYNISSAQNDEFGWDLILAKGTWLLEFFHQKGAGNAIATVRLDGSTLGTVDFYAAGTSYNNYGSVAGIVVAASGKHRLSLKAATRNASNTTGWTMPVQFISLRRTA